MILYLIIMPHAVLLFVSLILWHSIMMTEDRKQYIHKDDVIASLIYGSVFGMLWPITFASGAAVLFGLGIFYLVKWLLKHAGVEVR